MVHQPLLGIAAHTRLHIALNLHGCSPFSHVCRLTAFCPYPTVGHLLGVFAVRTPSFHIALNLHGRSPLLEIQGFLSALTLIRANTRRRGSRQPRKSDRREVGQKLIRDLSSAEKLMPLTLELKSSRHNQLGLFSHWGDRGAVYRGFRQMAAGEGFVRLGAGARAWAAECLSRRSLPRR